VPPVLLDWSPFYWVTADTDADRFEHTGILFLLQVRPTGPRSLVQLDLAGSGNMPHGFPRTQFALAPTRTGRGQLYGLLGPTVTRRLVGASDSLRDHWREGEIGTVGLPNYLTRVLLLDFPNRRLAVAEPDAWPSLAGRFTNIAALERGNREQIVLPVTAPNGRTYRALLDTGLSPFALWITLDVWQELTGLGGPGAGTRAHRVANPAGGMLFIGAPLRAPLRIGGFELAIGEAVYLAQGPSEARLELWRQPPDMVLGPSAFARAVVGINLSGGQVGLGRRIAP
jgi:hypothetical protein